MFIAFSYRDVGYILLNSDYILASLSDADWVALWQSGL